VRVRRSDVLGCLEPFCGVCRVHPDVDDGEVGPGTRDEGQQELEVRGLPDDLVTGLDEQPRDALPEQDGVIGEYHAHAVHGSPARTVVPPPACEVMVSRPPAAATRSCSPRSPELGRGSAPPGPVSATSTVSTPSWYRTSTVAEEPSACRATLVSASLTTKYAVASTVAGSGPRVSVSARASAGGRRAGGGGVQREREGQQPLLRAVVQVAFDPAALLNRH
jgi:hypothetical protein